MKNWPFASTVSSISRTLVDLADDALERPVRLAVTGLSQSGKTVFITALIHHLLIGRRLPFLDAVNSGRYIGGKIVPRYNLEIPEFPYHDYIGQITGAAPSWPDPTDRLREVRLALRFRPAGLIRRQLNDLRTVNVHIIDYPGEWLLDLPLLNLSFGEWSSSVFALCQAEPRRALGREWLEFHDALDLRRPAEEGVLHRAGTLYADFLARCKAPDLGLSFLQPGRFTMPGELRDAPILAFCPCRRPEGAGDPGKDSLYNAMVQRYEAYREKVVKRFYAEQVARFDRQVVLVDILKALNGSYEAFADMRRAIAAVVHCFTYGRTGFFGRLFNHKIDKLLFAATKADHVASNQHHNLRLLVEGMIADPAREVKFVGGELAAMAIASVKCTQTVVTEHEGRRLSCVRGIPNGRGTETLLFPGEVPETIPTAAEWDASRFKFLDFRPPAFPDAERTGLPHIHLDQALQFLIGDKLS